MKRKICVEHCSFGCEFASTCRYQRYLQMVQSGNCDFQIANHNLVLADVLSQKAGRRRVLLEYDAMIIDEAHTYGLVDHNAFILPITPQPYFPS